jgi:hypothetical protein
VLDLLFVMKDADGTVSTIEAADIDEEGPAFLAIDVAQPGALGSCRSPRRHPGPGSPGPSRRSRLQALSS